MKKMINLTLDRNSEYYRICKECHREFMARDKREKFCRNNNKCHDDFHNREKELKRFCKPAVTPPLPPEKAASPEILIGLRKDLKILSQYPIGWVNYWMLATELIRQDFDFNAYTSRFLSPEGDGSYFLEFGPYVINRETPDYFIIKLKQQ